jgi:hypothetical protein
LCSEDFQIINPASKQYNNPFNPLRKMLSGFTDEERWDLFHVANWAFIMSGTAGTTMRYPSQFYEDQMYDRYKVIGKFTKRIPWQKFYAQPAYDNLKVNRDDIIIFALKDSRRIIAWLYHEVPYKKRILIHPQVTFSGLLSQSYVIYWIDAQTGDTIRVDYAKGDGFTLTAPAFKGYIVCYICLESQI